MSKVDQGYYMPGEYEPHHGCIMIWPERPGSWIYGARRARNAFRDVIAAIAESEKVYVAAGRTCIESAVSMLLGEDAVFLPKENCYRMADSSKNAEDKNGGQFLWQHNIEIFEAETDDAWARDIAPTFVVKRVTSCEGTEQLLKRNRRLHHAEKGIRAISWEFNAWGGKVDGLYAAWDKDNAFADFFAKKYGYACERTAPFVLEGGSVHSDGEGTLLVTEACLLSAGRNPDLSKTEIEERLKRYLGAEKVLWLPRGIYQDETNEHVDNVCAFVRPGEVVLAWTDREDDPQYALSRQCLDYLERERDARGRRIRVHKLPIPDCPVCITQEELEGYTFEEGEDTREAGERLAASYVNFYFSNRAVVMPVFGGENETSDRRAVKILSELCPERKVIPVPARDILVGGGNIHCITQQIPALPE